MCSFELLHSQNHIVRMSLKLQDDMTGIPPPRVRKKNHSSEDMGGGGDPSESQWTHFDEPDALPLNLRFNVFDFLCIAISIGTYVADLGMDIFMAYVYYTSGFIGYFVLTLVFVIIPAGTMTAFSLRW